MAGHSKFKNIMHRKGAQDKKRSQLFSRLSKEITVAAKMGDPNPDHNPRLRLAVQEAKANSMPKDNIERAISKATGGDADTYEEIRYEGFGPGGIGIIVEALTDNRNRTASDVRSTFSKNGGNLGESNTVAFMFDRVGCITYLVDAGSADDILEAAIEAGADDCTSSDDGHEIFCEGGELNNVATALGEAIGEPTSAKLIWKPQNNIEISGDSASTLLKLLDALDDLDDVQNVFSNFDISDEEMERLTAA